MSVDDTPRLKLGQMADAQELDAMAINDALIQLDGFTGVWLISQSVATPPTTPADGDMYLLGASPTGAWSGAAHTIAYCIDGGWRFVTPFAGLGACIADESRLVAYTGSAWVDYAALMQFQNLSQLGINTSADSTNKLAVKSAALLFDNIGNGVQAKLNKHAAGDTASLLYQTNYSGRAEMGLTGDDNFHIKVSPDGAAWTDAAVIDKSSGALTLAAGAKLPNGSATVPSLALNSNHGFFYDGTNTGIGVTVAGVQTSWFNGTGYSVSLAGGGAAAISLSSEGGTNIAATRYSNTANGGNINFGKARGTIAVPLAVINGDQVGSTAASAHTGAGFNSCGYIRCFVTETGIISSTAIGTRWAIATCPIGSATQTEVLGIAATGITMFGATNVVIDANRALRLRSTTIAGAVTPAVAGNLFHHSDAQGGAGEVAVDTGAAYRHAGQAALKKLTADADATYTPRADGRIVRDSAVLTANRKLTLSVTNVTDGHCCRVTRRGASGGFTRGVYQADGTTLIVSLADNASADIAYDAVTGLWFQI